MKFIVDENLPPALAVWLSSRVHDARHVIELGLRGVSDRSIWTYAQQQNAIIVTRDSDFRGFISSDSGCVLQLSCGNCSTPKLLTWLSTHWDNVERRLADGEKQIQIT